MRYVFVLNPKAGAGDAKAKIQAAIDALPEKEQCVLYETKAIGDAIKYVKEFLADHPDEEVRFIACGGDGTINEVMNGAAGCERASVTCYPCGSGNDFVKAFGGQEIFLDIPAILAAEAKPIDLLKVGDRYSNNVVNFGFDTTVAISVNEARYKKGTSSKSAYTKGIVKALITSMKNTFTVTADGKVLNPDGKALLCTLANGQYVGGSFKCAPRAKVDDGLIEVCLVKPISRIRFVKIQDIYTKGNHLDEPSMQDIICYTQAKKVEVSAPAGFAYSLDGEIIYEDNFTVEIAPKAVNFAWPEKG
ncbi:MAG: diacylglycerol kinase family lipid kinase [Firmicutes bacterium]|nr:diacylglycerol kinase family lipid kinase [Bacillota bacterium]